MTRIYLFEAGGFPPAGGTPAGLFAPPISPPGGRVELPPFGWVVGGFVAGPRAEFAFSTIELLFPFALARALVLLLPVVWPHSCIAITTDKKTVVSKTNRNIYLPLLFRELLIVGRIFVLWNTIAGV